MKAGEEWEWWGECRCCGCQVVYRVQWTWMGHHELSVQHEGEQARVWVLDSVVREAGADMKAAIVDVTDRLYGSGLC